MSDRARLAAFAVLALVLLLGLTAALLALQAGAAAERISAALAPYAEITYGRVLINASGDLTLRGIRIVPKSNPRAALVASSGRIVSPGPVWLLRTTFGGGEGIPATGALRVELDGVALEGSGEIAPGLGFIGFASGSPFEAAGCGVVTRWGNPDLAQMALRVSPAQVSIDYRALGSELAELNVGLHVPGSSRIDHRRVLRLARPREPLSNTAAESALVEFGWSVHDDGFVAARNRYCAQRLRITRNLLVEGHLDSIEQWLERRGLMAEPEALDMYRRYAARGGDIALRSKLATPATFADLAKLDPASRTLALDAKLGVAGRAAVPFVLRPATQMDFVGPPESPEAPTAPEVIAVGGAPAPVDPVSATPSIPVAGNGVATAPRPAPPADPVADVVRTPTRVPSVSAGPAPTLAANSRSSSNGAGSRASATTPVVPASPYGATPPSIGRLKLGVVAYVDLKHAVGRRVVINTIFKSRRVGVLRDYNGEAVTLELPPREGRMLVTLPKGTIVRAEVLDPRLVPEVADAQAN